MINLVVATNNFNIVDKIIAYFRLSQVKRLIDKGDSVMDFGCGTQGYFLKYVSETINTGLGLDYEVENQKVGNLEFKRFHFKDTLPIKDKTFDKAVMLAVMEHINLDEVDRVFKEFHRVLKEDGQIILTTPTPLSKPLLELLARLNIISRNEIQDHKKYYSFKDMEAVATRNKLKLVSYRLFQLGLNSVAILEKI
jgi:cyclopropane fatty-acyl-phospholipid synthase-like methyltransferase